MEKETKTNGYEAVRNVNNDDDDDGGGSGDHKDSKNDVTSGGDDVIVGSRCGVGRCTPNCVQRFATVGWFTFFYSIASLLMSTIMTYVNSQITTLERQFGFNSKQTGLIMAANDIGYLVCVLLVSYTAKMVHIPKALGIATIIYGVSGIICSFPHFVYSGTFDTEVVGGDNNMTSLPSKVEATLQMNESLFGQLCSFENKTVQTCKAGGNPTQSVTSARETAVSSLAIIVVGMMLQGFGKAPRASFSIVYIDDNTKRVKSGFYFGILIAISIMGPAVAFFLGGIFSRIYVTLEDTDLNPKHPKWIGAWWLGFIVFGAIALIVSLPLFCFPAKLPRNNKKNVEDKDHNDNDKCENIEHGDSNTLVKKETEAVNGRNGSYGNSHHHSNGRDKSNTDDGKVSFLTKILQQIKLFLKSLLRLCTNPIYVLMVASNCFILFMVGGTSAYTPKYLERVFDLPAYLANYIMAGKTLFASVIGTFLGGYLTRVYKMTAKKALKFCVMMVGISALFSLSSLLTYCDQPKIYNWPGESDEDDQSCNNNCNCEDNSYFPVCGSDGKTYYSPCSAGCVSFGNGRYTNCTCIDGGQATTDICPYGCDHIYYFTAVRALWSLGATLAIIPKVTVIIRSVEERDKSLALGLSSFMTSLLGWLAGPVVFGILIDNICVLWDQQCDVTGRCLLYDNDLFRWKLNGYGSVGLACSFLLQLSALCYALKSGCLDDIGVDGRKDEVDGKKGNENGTVGGGGGGGGGGDEGIDGEGEGNNNDNSMEDTRESGGNYFERDNERGVNRHDEGMIKMKDLESKERQEKNKKKMDDSEKQELLADDSGFKDDSNDGDDDDDDDDDSGDKGKHNEMNGRKE